MGRQQCGKPIVLQRCADVLFPLLGVGAVAFHKQGWHCVEHAQWRRVVLCRACRAWCAQHHNDQKHIVAYTRTCLPISSTGETVSCCTAGALSAYSGSDKTCGFLALLEQRLLLDGGCHPSSSQPSKYAGSNSMPPGDSTNSTGVGCAAVCSCDIVQLVHKMSHAGVLGRGTSVE